MLSNFHSNKAIDLFGEQGAITTCLRNHASSDDVKKAVTKVCDEVGESFRLWDAVFKAIHEEDPSTEHCTQTQKLIDLAMKHWRKCLKMSIIPKLHGLEAHVVMQMRTIKGGICRMIEHWVEQYHQVGYRYDLSYCRVGSLKRQAEVRSKMEKRARHPRVKMNKKRLQDIKKKRTARKTKQQEKAAIKKEMREKAVEEVKVKLENMSAEEVNEIMDDIELLIDVEEVQQLGDEISN